MWDFLLVLGQVPGTNFQITFLEIVLFCLAIGGIFAWRQRIQLRARKQHLELWALKLRVYWQLRKIA